MSSDLFDASAGPWVETPGKPWGSVQEPPSKLHHHNPWSLPAPFHAIKSVPSCCASAGAWVEVGPPLPTTCCGDQPLSQSEANIAWVRDYYAAIHPHSGVSGGYVNFMAGDDAERVADNYGPNYDRLVEVKGAYDPGNVFRLNQNIRPRADGARRTSGERPRNTSVCILLA